MKQLIAILAVAAMAAPGPVSAGLTKVSGDKSGMAKVSPRLEYAAVAPAVLAVREMAPGVTKRIVRDESGRIYMDMVRQGKTTPGRTALRPIVKESSGASFYEGFEGHQGELDWLPEGWTEINTEANIPTPEMCAHNINNSWAVEDTGDGYWTDRTSDGVKECWIHFTYSWSYKGADGNTVSGGPDAQDEWLITPAINVNAGEDLYFLCEFDLGSVLAFDWNTMKYDHSSIDCDLEVLVSTNDGADWQSVWKISEDVCGNMTDDEMYDQMAEMKYAAYNIPLTAYAGRTIKVAFRYTNVGIGFAGNSAAVDAVTVSAPTPEAFYNLPYGTLLAGISDGLHVYTESYGLFPAYSDIIWKAESNAYTTSNSWLFNDMNGNEYLTSDDNEVTVNFPYNGGNAVPWPVLTAANPNGSHTYNFDMLDAEPGGMVFGGKIMNVAEDEVTYLGNYDYQHNRLTIPYLSENNYVYGTHQPGIWGNNVVQTGFANFFYAPASPLSVEDVMLTLGEFDADDDAELNLEIYPVNEYGQVAETPAVISTITGAEIEGVGFYNAVFHLDTPYIMEGNTLMMITGFANNPKIRTLGACAQSVNNDANHNYAYMMFEIQGQPSLYAASDALSDYSSALILGLNGAFHFLRPSEEIIDLDPATNSYELTVEGTSTPDTWWIVNGEEQIPLVSEGTDYEWMRVTPVTGESGQHKLLFEAEPVSSSRAKTVVICNGGDPRNIRVRQSATSGIQQIGQGNGEIRIYSVDGILMMSGGNELDIRTLPHGIYIIKTDGKTYRLAL